MSNMSFDEQLAALGRKHHEELAQRDEAVQAATNQLVSSEMRDELELSKKRITELEERLEHAKQKALHTLRLKRQRDLDSASVSTILMQLIACSLLLFSSCELNVCGVGSEAD